MAEAARLGNPLGHGNFLSGLKLSGERDGGLSLAQFSAVCPLGVGRPYVRKWPFMVRGTQIWQVLCVWAKLRKFEQSFCCAVV